MAILSQPRQVVAAGAAAHVHERFGRRHADLAPTPFFGDLTLMEPGLLQMYGELFPRIDKAIGTRGAAPSAAR